MRKPTNRSVHTVICLSALVLSLSALLIGCSKGGDVDTSATQKSQKASDRKLYIYNWSYYTPDEVIAQFEKEYDCDVVLDYFASNEEMFAKLMAGGGQGYDIIFPSGDYVSIMKTLGMLEPIDLEKITNASNISDLVLSKATYDPDMKYSVPYFMGAAGIAVNKSMVKDYSHDWNIFGDTRLAGRMCMMDDMREVMGDALAYLGYSVNTVDPQQLEEARRLINDRWKPNLVKFDAEGFAKSFASGEFWVVQGYAEAVFEELSEDKWSNVDFFLPQDGGPMYIDSMCIPKGAKHIDLAHEFINFIHRPEIYAQFLDRFHFPASVNPAAEQFTTTKPFYTVEMLTNYELKEDLGPNLETYNKIWETIRYIG
ncbi:MAG: extracellular solute-binding protein [Sphaerochaetaceae bacterium]